MRIEIWSDIVCPWCYIGKRRLERALAGFEHRDEVELVWRSFQLNPAAPEVPEETIAEHLGRKYGGGTEAGQKMVDQMEAVAAEEGLLYRLGEAAAVGTMTAHRLLHAAGERRGELKEALLAAYFLEAANIADADVLRRIAAEVGLDPVAVEEVLTTDVHADEVEADIRQAAAYGATGVPFFVLDGRLGISGAQPVEVFAQALHQAWDAAHPVLQMAGDGTSEACGPEGCAV